MSKDGIYINDFVYFLGFVLGVLWKEKVCGHFCAFYLLF